jgi:hypothetical protein
MELHQYSFKSKQHKELKERGNTKKYGKIRKSTEKHRKVRISLKKYQEVQKSAFLPCQQYNERYSKT